MDTIVHPGRHDNYNSYGENLKNELENTELTKEDIKLLAKAWHLKQERILVGHCYQIKLKRTSC